MKRVVLEHTASFLIVGAISLFLLSLVHSYQEASETETLRIIAPYLSLDSMDLTDPLQRALFKETLTAFHSDNPARIDSITAALDSYTVRLLADPGWKGTNEKGLAGRSIPRLIWMYVQFALIFLLVSALTSVGARSAAIYRYMKEKGGNGSSVQDISSLFSMWRSGNLPPRPFKKILGLLGRTGLRVVFSLILFSPAYVLAYALKTEVDTSGVFFMVLLAVVSNGVLVNLSGSFHTFLTHESRRGYVETATVKGLETGYQLPSHPLQTIFALFRPMQAYSRHVFQHIYMNASFQFVPAIKQHIAFIITGIMIIEMALNVQGHLSYELLQCVLFGDYDTAVIIGLGIFFLVKITELIVDAWHVREARRYHMVS